MISTVWQHNLGKVNDMGRLIDVNELIKRFKGLRDEHETHSISYNALYEILVGFPTAYEVEEFADYLIEWIVSKNDMEFNRQTEFHIVRMIVDCVEIYRKGGIDG